MESSKVLFSVAQVSFWHVYVVVCIYCLCTFPPNKQLPQLLGGSVLFFSRTLAFVNINNQSRRKEVGWNVEYGWWGQKDPVKQAVQSLIYTEWTFYEIFMDFQAFPTKMFTKICPNHHFPNFFTWNLFFEKCPPVIHKSLTFGFFSWRSPTMRHWNGSRFHPREGHQVRIFTARWCRTCGEWESR